MLCYVETVDASVFTPHSTLYKVLRKSKCLDKHSIQCIVCFDLCIDSVDKQDTIHNIYMLYMSILLIQDKDLLCIQCYLCRHCRYKTHPHISALNFLNIQPIFNPQKVLESFSTIPSNTICLTSAQPCVGKLGISHVLLHFLGCNFRLWFETP